MPNAEEQKGGQLYLEHLEELQYAEENKKEAIELAERTGGDVEQMRRSHDLTIESYKESQEKQRQEMGRSSSKDKEASHRVDAFEERRQRLKEKQQQRRNERDRGR